MPLTITTPPSGRLVTREQLRAQCRIDHTSEDELIDGYHDAAVALLQEHTRRQFLQAGAELTLYRFPAGRGPVEIRRAPVLSVDAIEYLDPEGELQQLDPDVDVLKALQRTPPFLLPAVHQSWPAVVSDHPEGVTITLTLGYGPADDVPEIAKQAVRLLVGHWFLNREAVGQVPPEIALAWQSCVDQLAWTALPDPCEAAR